MCLGMRIFSCENPQTIVNPYSHKVYRVRCRKCPSCLNHHAKYWIDKLEHERRSWRYCYMVTLTFDDAHLNCLYDDGLGHLVDYKNADVCIPFSDLNIAKDSDFKYLNARLKHRLGIPYHRTDVIQKFHKRLNKYIHDNITQKYQNFRYFVAEEYGSDTLRPHYHGLYFFSDQRIARNFKEILFTCWQNSDNVSKGVEADTVRGSASSYVAQYINMFSSLPSFYSHGALKPRYFYSKRPPLGSLSFIESDEELFFRCSPCRVEKGIKKNEFVDVPIPYSVRNRLFPRIPKYDELSLSMRVELYGLCRKLDSFSFRSFCSFLKNSVYGDCTSIKCQFNAPRNSEYFQNVRSYLLWLTNGFRFDCSQYLNVEDYNCIINRVKRFYYIINRVSWQASAFDIGIYDYVRHIDEFYNNVSSFKLKSFYEQQEHYTKSLHDVEDLGFMYDCPSDYWNLHKFEYIPIFEDSFAFKDIHLTAEKIYRDSIKTHKKNDYLDRCRDKKLSLIMKSYFDLWQKM